MINQFLSYFSAVRGRSARTCSEYRKELLYLQGWLGSPLHMITRAQMDAYLIHCQTCNNSESTRARKISTLRTFLSWAVYSGHISTNPIATMPRPCIPSTVPRFLSLNEAKFLISSTRSQKNLFYRRRNTCIIILLLNTGLRLSELSNIKLLDISDDILFVSGKGKRERFVYLNRSCQRAIRLWLSYRMSEADNLFVSKQGRPLSSSAVASMVKCELVRADLANRKLSTHKLRHTCATLMYQSGSDIRLLQSVLGHASISTTEIYTHVLDDQIIAAFKSHPLADF